MYVTVFLRQTQAEASGCDFTEVTPRLLDNDKECVCDAVSVTGSLNGGRLCFYDKNGADRKRGAIPALYIGRSVLRYERRYAQRMAAKFKVSEVPEKMLYNEAFYTQVLQGWRTDYQAIRKINDISTSISIQNMRTKRQLYTRRVLFMVEAKGGLLQMLDWITESQQRGELTKRGQSDNTGTI